MNDMKMYTTEEASEILKVKSKTIRSYINNKKLEAVKVGRKWLISESNLDKFLKR